MSSTPPVSTKRSFFSRNSSRSATPQPDQAAQLAKQLDATSLDGDAGAAGDDESTPLEGLDDVAAELQGTDTDSESGQSSWRESYVLPRPSMRRAPGCCFERRLCPDRQIG